MYAHQSHDWIKDFINQTQYAPLKQAHTQIKTLQKYHKIIAHLSSHISQPSSEQFHTTGTPRLIAGKVKRVKK